MNALKRHGTTRFSSGRVLGSSVGSSSYFFGIGTCVDQTQVSQSDTSYGEMGWTGNWVDEGETWNT